MRWLVAVVVAGCAAAPAIAPEPGFDAGPDASPASGGNAQGGAPAGGAAGSGGSVEAGGVPGAGGAAVTVTAKCTTPVGGLVWAEAGFGGKSAAELVRVVAYRAADPAEGPSWASARVIPTLVTGEGKAAAPCGVVGSGGAPDVTFVLP